MDKLSTDPHMHVLKKTDIQRDLDHIWHPCSYMKDFEQYPPFIVYSAQGSYLNTEHGRVIDAISSWWCKSLGHGHPAVIAAIEAQLHRFEHVISANTTHPAMIELGEALYEISNKHHVMFASDGASAVEIALKLALQATQHKGEPHRNQYVALSKGYHGETFATLSISDLGLYKEPFSIAQLPCHFLNGIPYVHGQTDPLWFNCGDAWASTEQQLLTVKDRVCAIVLEPIVQGAGGMLCYSADFLRKIALFAKKHDIYLIADEIMTGLGRTGEWLACHHAHIEPDIICLSKGLTSGSLPLSCVLIDKAIYALFYREHKAGGGFLHSHTFSGHSLAISAALATIQTMRRDEINQQAEALGRYMKKLFEQVATQTGKLQHIRSLGAIVAADLVGPEDARIGYHLAQEALLQGALLRPLGNTLYWLPPLTTTRHTIDKLAEITARSIDMTYNRLSACIA